MSTLLPGENSIQGVALIGPSSNKLWGGRVSALRRYPLQSECCLSWLTMRGWTVRFTNNQALTRPCSAKCQPSPVVIDCDRLAPVAMRLLAGCCVAGTPKNMLKNVWRPALLHQKYANIYGGFRFFIVFFYDFEHSFCRRSAVARYTTYSVL